MGEQKRVMLVAGEASADIHAAQLLRAVRARRPEVTFFGVGGRHLQNAGMEIWIQSSEVAVVGLTEVLRHIRPIRRAMNRLKQALLQDPPDLLVLLDFPDFNLRLAATAREAGVPVLYYISPQVWAWRRKRVYKIARLVDRLLVVFPFEPDCYADTGLDVRFVGHPLLDELELPEQSKPYDPASPVVALVPGSRTGEIIRMLPVMISVARRLLAALPRVRFVLPVAPTIEQELMQTEVGFLSAGASLPIEYTDGAADTWRQADFALVTSGTSTLEAGLFGVPMFVCYRLSWLTYLLGRLLVKVKMIGLVNHVLGRKAMPEFLQTAVSPARLTPAVLDLLTNPERLAALRGELDELRSRMGGPGASERAAEALLELLDR